MKRVAAAAILRAGKIYTLPRPARHHDIIHDMAARGLKPPIGEQGFVDESGRFLTRCRAWIVAKRAGQILPTRIMGGATLFTEDVW